MKKSVFIMIAALFLINSAVFTQTPEKFRKHLSFYTGMGVNFGITPDFNDYLIASIPYSTTDSINSFNAGVEFFGGFEQDLTSCISAGVEYSYFIRGFSYTFSPAVFDYTVTNHQPYAFFNYNLRKPKYHLKIGAMIGYHFQQLDYKISNSTTLKYNSTGPSIKADFTMLPKLSENFFLYINGFAYANFYGKLKDENGNFLKAANLSTDTNLKGYGVGARLGILFNIN